MCDPEQIVLVFLLIFLISDKLLKLLIVGESGVGKSSILTRFTEDTFSSDFMTTIGVDFKFKSLVIEGKTIR